MHVDNWNEWVAIDFETASEWERGTPIQIGMVEVNAGLPGRSQEPLVHQPASRFGAYAISIHGITPADVKSAPSWPDALAELLEFVDGRPIIAHWAQFDLGVIRDACDEWQLAWPELSYACTVCIGRRAWPDLPSHSLSYLAPALGLELDHTKLHRGLYDAHLAASIANHAMQATQTSTLDALLQTLRVQPGTIAPTTWHGCHSVTRPAGSIELNPNADPAGQLYAAKVAFTGALWVPRRQAQALVAQAGGIPQDGVRKDTDYLVTGHQDISVLATGQQHSGKMRKALALRSAGAHLELLSEADFLRMLQP